MLTAYASNESLKSSALQGVMKMVEMNRMTKRPGQTDWANSLFTALSHPNSADPWRYTERPSADSDGKLRRADKELEFLRGNGSKQVFNELVL
jgi:hypothetical protein